MVDCTIYTNKNFLQLLKGNPDYQRIIAEASVWQEVVDVIDSLEIQYTAEQLKYVMDKEFN